MPVQPVTRTLPPNGSSPEEESAQAPWSHRLPSGGSEPTWRLTREASAWKL